MSDTEHSIYSSSCIAFTVLEESGQAYFSCARMPGFLIFFEKDRTSLLACFDNAENEFSKACQTRGRQLDRLS